jgi:hypothetical protein
VENIRQTDEGIMKFYTYIWFRKNGTPFYVGKGSGNRAFSKKMHRQIPPEPSRVLIEFWESEQEAFEMEKWYIKLFGRKDNCTGILRNLTDGGEGNSGNVCSEKTRKLKSENAKRLGLKPPPNSAKGIVWSDVSRKKLSKSKTGKSRAAGSITHLLGNKRNPYGRWGKKGKPQCV